MQEEFNQLPQIDSRLRKNIYGCRKPSFRQAALSLTAGASKASSLRPTLPSSETATPTRSLPSIPSRPSRQSATPSSKRPTFRSSAALAAARRRACARYLWQGRRIAGCDGRSSERADLGPQPSCGIKAVDIPCHCHRYQRGHRHCHAFRERRVDSEHCLRLQNAGGCAQNPGAIPAGA